MRPRQLDRDTLALLHVRLQHHRQAHDELAAAAYPFTVRRHRATMHFHQSFHQWQPKAQAAAGPLRLAIDLHEQIKDPGQQFRRDPDPVSQMLTVT